MSCAEFIASHSEYVDGRLTPAMTARLGAHAAVCASCARYDRVVRRGGELVRDLPEVLPSDEFEARLQHRIFHEQDATALGANRASGAAVALAAAAAIALLAWSPLLMQGEVDAPAPATAPVTVMPQPVDDARPFGEQTWYPMTLPVAPVHQPDGLLAMFPGPYSPLVVTPPAHRSVRTVSSEFAPID